MARRAARKKPKLSPQALSIVARRFSVLGDATRLAILQELFDGELSVRELCRRTKAGQANVSKHLSIMVDQGFLGKRKSGLFVYYRIIDTSVCAMCELVCGALADRFETASHQFGT